MRDAEKYRNNSIQLLKDNDLFKYLVDIKKLVKKLNIEVRYKDLDDDISGKIEYNANQEKDVIIIIDHNDIEFRQNFSLAHEIGHYRHDIDFSQEHYEKEDKTIFLRSSVVDPIEIRTNKYAERLLMPFDLFDDRTDQIKEEFFPDLDNKLGARNIYKIVDKLSEDFKVDSLFTMKRLYNIGKISAHMKQNLLYYENLLGDIEPNNYV